MNAARRVASALVVAGGDARAVGQQPRRCRQRATPVFRSSVNLVLVDVVVRDKNGAVVKGLTTDDFELLEDGKPQQILTFASEEIAANAAPVATASTLSAAAAAATADSPPPAARRSRRAAAAPAGRRRRRRRR